jgi:hypothetical protein
MGDRRFFSGVIAIALFAAACGSEEEPYDGLLRPPDEGKGLQISLGITVQPGDEAMVCKNVRVPAELDFVERFEHRSSHNLHHLLLFQTGLTDDEITDDLILDCGEDVRANEVRIGFAYGSQTDSDDLPLPEGIAYRTVPGLAMQIEFHVLNTTDAPIDVEGAINLWKSDGPVVGEAGAIFMYHPTIAIEPGGTLTARQRCPIVEDIKLLTMLGHMHSRGVTFHAEVAGGPVLADLVGWDTDSLHFEPAIDLPAGSIIEYSCDFRNDTGELIVEGPTATRNEMCATGGLYYKEQGERMLLGDEVCWGEGIVYTGADACMPTEACVQAIDWSDWETSPKPSERYELCRVKQCDATYDSFDACRWTMCRDTCFTVPSGSEYPTEYRPQDAACTGCLDTMCGAEREACVAHACP